MLWLHGFFQWDSWDLVREIHGRWPMLNPLVFHWCSIGFQFVCVIVVSIQKIIGLSRIMFFFWIKGCDHRCWLKRRDLPKVLLHFFGTVGVHWFGGDYQYDFSITRRCPQRKTASFTNKITHHIQDVCILTLHTCISEYYAVDVHIRCWSHLECFLSPYRSWFE